jgi:hypothetical protein
MYLIWLPSSHFIYSYQFSFKAKHGTDQCIFVLKEVIDFYASCSSPVYLCFMDSSKAFDRVNHYCLFDKLLRRGVPPIAVRLLCTWFSSQSFIVRWSSVLSESFTVSNGVRQGGVLSPVLFNVFMNDLSIKLQSQNSGCSFNGIMLNHLFYADDSVLIAPSPTALQNLISVCQEYAMDNDIKYNTLKTV